jgi:hypothetical protein
MPSASGPEPLIGPCGPVRRRRGARDTRESFRKTTGRVDGRPNKLGRGGESIPGNFYTSSAEKLVAERRTLHSTLQNGPRCRQGPENRRLFDPFAKSVGCMGAERNAPARHKDTPSSCHPVKSVPWGMVQMRAPFLAVVCVAVAVANRSPPKRKKLPKVLPELASFCLLQDRAFPARDPRAHGAPHPCHGVFYGLATVSRKVGLRASNRSVSSCSMPRAILMR